MLATATTARPGLVAAAEAVLTEPLQPHQKRILEAIEERAKRATCPECGTRQKTRKDGTIGKHTYGPEGRACAGEGKEPA